MTKNQLQALAVSLGLTLYTYSPGDGVKRYRFFQDRNVTDYFDGEPLYTAWGAKEAGYWLEGFRAGKRGQQ